MMSETEIREWKNLLMKNKTDLIFIAGEIAIDGFSRKLSEACGSGLLPFNEIKERIKAIDTNLMLIDRILCEGTFAPLKGDVE